MDILLLRPAAHKLWNLGQSRPNGLPKIDWSHPLTQRLISYWWPFADTGYIDLVTGDTTKKATGTKNTLPVLSGSSYGPGPGFTTTAMMCESVNFAPIQSWSAPYSFAVGWYQLGTMTFSTTQAGWFGLADSSGNDAFMTFPPSAGNFTWSYGNTSGQPTIAIANNTFNVAVGVATGATSQANYLNGIARTAGTATSAFSGSSQRYLFGATSTDNNTTLDNPNSLVFFGAAWNGIALSASDAALLYSDPYCFLVPQEPEMMIIQAAAVADVLQSQIWM